MLGSILDYLNGMDAKTSLFPFLHTMTAIRKLDHSTFLDNISENLIKLEHSVVEW